MSMQTHPGVQHLETTGNGPDRRDRDLRLREGFLPERRKLVTVLVRDPNTGDSRCSIFPDIEFAERFIRARIQVAGRQAFLAFWTLGEDPELPGVSDGERRPAVVVVSRNGEVRELVKPLAFPDMETARIYFESDREREIAAANASVFWALPLQIRRDGAGVVRLSPPFPRLVHHSSEQFEHLRTPVPVPNVGTGRDQDMPWRDKITAVRSVLTVERWPSREPRTFEGFHSPPGKF